jgi:hypothetical protein
MYGAAIDTISCLRPLDWLALLGDGALAKDFHFTNGGRISDAAFDADLRKLSELFGAPRARRAIEHLQIQQEWVIA